MTILSKTQMIVSGCITLGILVIGVVTYIYFERQNTKALSELFVEVESQLHTYSGHLSSQETPLAYEGLWEPCPIPLQQEFDAQLSQLETLPISDLGRVQYLIERCAFHHSYQQKAVVHAMEILSISLRRVSDALSLSGVLVESQQSTALLWEQIISLERRRADLLYELVDIQRAIVDLLYGGSSSDDEFVLSLRDRSVTVRQEIVSLRTEIQQVRGHLGES